MIRSISRLVVVLAALSSAPICLAQDKSVKPGINDSFRDPDVEKFVGRFEIESREVYAHRNEIVAACRILPGQTVADIGAGTGLFTRLFSEAVGKDGRVIAVDISPKFLDHIRDSSRQAGQLNVETQLCTADSTELPPESVDVAFICDTYHHFEFPQKTMASLFRAMKPGGRVILIDFRRIEGESSEWTLSHVRAGQDVFEAEIVSTGFQKVEVKQELLKENYFVVFEKSDLVFPVIPNYGGAKPKPGAAEQPRAGARVVFDATSAAKPEEVNKALVRVARLLNLYGSAGLKASDVRIAIVFHGDATGTVLHDQAYQSHFEVEKNPNLPLIGELKKAGVELFVCGQALHYKGYADQEVSEHVHIAAAALTVVINKQQDGYAYVPVP